MGLEKISSLGKPSSDFSKPSHAFKSRPSKKTRWREVPGGPREGLRAGWEDQPKAEELRGSSRHVSP